MPDTVNLDLAPEYWKPLRVIGVSRDAENPKGLCLYMTREYSDGELRKLHEALKLAVEEMETGKPTPSERFGEWVGKGPDLAKAAGVYVGIHVYDQDPAKKGH